MLDPGIQLQLLVGENLPRPVSNDVISSLLEVEVTNNDERRDGFQLTFGLERRPTARDYAILQDGVFNPPNRVCIIVFIKGRPQILINGAATQHQMLPSNEPGQTKLKITGEDLGVLLDLEERPATYRNLADSAIVEQIVSNYSFLRPNATRTNDVPSETDRITSQQKSDLAFIHNLARRNSFVFYTEPSPIPGTSIAYWGPRDRQGQPPQPALSTNMGPNSNVEQISFSFNALGPATPEVSILEPLTGQLIAFPAPNPLAAALASQPATPLRERSVTGVAHLNPAQAMLQALVEAGEGASDAVTGRGQLDTVRYGQALRSRQQVEVRGAGHSYDGAYYVSQVTHNIRPGEYKQSFVLKRGGRGAAREFVNP